jgi:hypothetical protein
MIDDPVAVSKSATLPVQRLCNEIQLFDLCDRVSCLIKEGRFCTDGQLVAAFEKISDREDRPPEKYISDDAEGIDEDSQEGYDDAFDEDSGDDAEFEDDF